MAVKLADTLQAMADFPVAMASGINIVKEDDTEKDLQQMYEDGELGGESMPMPLSANMLLVSENDETSGDLIWSQIDKSEVGSVPLICTEEEWEELDPKPVEGTEVIITDDEIDGDSLPFKFGIDENGNYGYYKVGADTVTPFKSGELEDTGKIYGTNSRIKLMKMGNLRYFDSVSGDFIERGMADIVLDEEDRPLSNTTIKGAFTNDGKNWIYGQIVIGTDGKINFGSQAGYFSFTNCHWIAKD